MSGCIAGEPEHTPLAINGYMDASTGKDPEEPDCVNGQADLQGIFHLSFPSTTSYTIQPIHGTAPGAAFVVATGPLGVEPNVPVSQDGTFCIEVELKKNSSNSIQLQPFDKNGCVGPSTQITINQQMGGSTTPSKPTNTLRNLSEGRSIDSNEGDSSIGVFNDGDEGSWGSISVFDFEFSSQCGDSAYAWLLVDLGQTYTITEVRMLYPPEVGNKYALCYMVMASNQTNPPEPSPSNGWIEVHPLVEDGGPGVQSIGTSGIEARWAAVLLYENGGYSPTMYETFNIAEFQVFGYDKDGRDAPANERCQ